MAIYDDDFQSYLLGASIPFGSWILDPSAFTNVIVAGNGPDGTTQSYRLDGTVAVDPSVTGFITSWTEFVSVWALQGAEILNFANGPNGTGHTFSIVTVKVEQDGTISVIGPDTNVIQNSIDKWFNFNSSNFLQVNVTLSDVSPGIGMPDVINIQCQIGLNGVKVIDFNYMTNTPVTDLVNGTSQVNRFQLSGAAFYSAFTLQSLIGLINYPHPGLPNALVYQSVVEIANLPDTTKVQVFQGVIELLIGLGPCYISES